VPNHKKALFESGQCAKSDLPHNRLWTSQKTTSIVFAEHNFATNETVFNLVMFQMIKKLNVPTTTRDKWDFYLECAF